MRTLLVVSLVAAVSAVGCGGGTEKKPFGKSDVESIRQQAKDLATAFNAHDVQKVMMVYPAAAVLMPPNASTLRGNEMIQAFYADLLENGASGFELDIKDVSGEGNMAYGSGNYRMTTKSPDGGEEVRDRGKYLIVLQNLGGQWKFEYTIWSSDFPPVVPTAGS